MVRKVFFCAYNRKKGWVMFYCSPDGRIYGKRNPNAGEIPRFNIDDLLKDYGKCDVIEPEELIGYEIGGVDIFELEEEELKHGVRQGGNE
jgi:hypothetical protein